jgi:hypothetical protein
MPLLTALLMLTACDAVQIVERSDIAAWVKLQLDPIFFLWLTAA